MSSTKTRLPKSALSVQAKQWLLSANWSIAVLRGVRVISSSSDEDSLPASTKFTCRLYAKGAPLQAKREVIEELRRHDTWIDPVVDGVTLSGEWKFRFAVITRDVGTGSERGDFTYTVIMDWYEAATSSSVTVDDGCDSRTDIRYEWDVGSIEPLADIEHYGEQGYDVKIGGVNRDPESNLFSYIVSVTERKTKVLGPYVVASDEFSTDYAVEWTGLRGTIASPVDDSGTEVDVYSPLSHVDGEEISVQWSRNANDCTLNAQARKRVAKADVVSGEACSRDLFAERDGTTTSAQSSKLGHAPAPSGGISYQHQSKQRPDGKWDNSVEKIAESTVPDAAVTSEVTAFSSRTRRTVKSQSEAVGTAFVGGGLVKSVTFQKTAGDLKDVTVDEKQELSVKASRVVKGIDVFGTEQVVVDVGQTDAPSDIVAGGGVSGSTTSELTEGLLRNNSVSTKIENTVEDAQTSQQVTLFSKKTRATVKSSHSDRPPASASGGIGVSSSAQVTPGGLRDVSVETDEEVFCASATVEEYETLFERIRTYTDVNSKLARPAATVADGVITKTSEATQPFGSKNITVQVHTEKQVIGAGAGAGGDLYQTRVTGSSKSVADAGLGETGNTEPGVIVERSKQATPGGRVDVTESTVTYNPVTGSRRSVRSTAFGKIITESDSNQTEPFSDPSAGSSESSEYTKTPASLYDRSKTTYEMIDGVVSATTKDGDFFGTVVSETVIVEDMDDDEKYGLQANHSIIGVHYSRREDGFWNKTTTTKTPTKDIFFWFDKSYTEKVDGEYVTKTMHIMHFTQCVWQFVQDTFNATAVSPTSLRVDASPDDFGLYTGSISYTTQTTS